MTYRVRMRVGVLLSLVLLSGCGRKEAAPAAEIAGANSYLYAVVRDLCGDETVLFCVVPPGMCPGHFDIRPSDVQRLFACRVLLAFDFQRAIGAILPEQGGRPAFYTVSVPPGMCLPETYLAMSREVADILIAEYPQREAYFRQRLEAFGVRMAALEQDCHAAIELLGASGATVLTSRHQAAFCEWLGLRAAGTFSGRDSETAANINSALRESEGQALRWVVANRQEGTPLAESLGRRVGAPVAVFSNFPSVFAESVEAPAFDAMVRENLRRLGEAGQ